MHHELKILPQYFETVLEGRKTFEIRKDDRGFRAGDAVTLREYDHERYTGRELKFIIGFVTSYEQQHGYVVFSLLDGLQGLSKNRRQQ